MAEGGKPLAGQRVLVTRAEDQAAALVERLEMLGAESLVVPAIETAPLDDPAPLERAVRLLDETDWLAFTSTNGVRYAVPVIERIWPEGLPETVRVAAIGPGTAEALAERQIRVDFVPPVHVAESLAETLPLEREARVLLLRGDLARRALVTELEARGATVGDVPAYHTRPAADGTALREALSRQPTAVTFTSASTADGFAAALGGTPWPTGLRSVAIGPITAAALRRLGLPVHAVADPYTLDGLLDALVQTYV